MIPYIHAKRGEMSIILSIFRILFGFKKKIHWNRDHMVQKPDKSSRPPPNKKEGKNSEAYENDSYHQPNEDALILFLWGIDQRRVEVQNKGDDSK
jgi:hypothetical protein